MAEFLEKNFAMIEKHNKLIEEQDFFEKNQTLIFFNFRFKFFFHPQFVVIFVNIFLVPKKIIVFFSWCSCNIGADED
jgi:hypothetical protein